MATNAAIEKAETRVRVRMTISKVRERNWSMLRDTISKSPASYPALVQVPVEYQRIMLNTSADASRHPPDEKTLRGWYDR